jgi:hypothetical protein
MAQEEKKSGLTAIEYGLLSAVVAVFVITAITVGGEIVGQKIADDEQAELWAARELRDLRAQNEAMRAKLGECEEVTP